MLSDNKLLAAWRIARRNLQFWKVAENFLRVAVTERFFPHAIKGVQYSTYAPLKATVKWNVSFAKDRNVIMETLEKIGLAFPDVPIGCVIDWKPHLVQKEYDALPEAVRRMFDECITMKPGLPQVSFIDEKENEE